MAAVRWVAYHFSKSQGVNEFFSPTAVEWLEASTIVVRACHSSIRMLFSHFFLYWRHIVLLIFILKRYLGREFIYRAADGSNNVSFPNILEEAKRNVIDFVAIRTFCGLISEPQVHRMLGAWNLGQFSQVLSQSLKFFLTPCWLGRVSSHIQIRFPASYFTLLPSLSMVGILRAPTLYRCFQSHLI